ncbi:MAG: hypothetical protein AAF483_04275 [Planctomycetota bacterium]
MNKNSHKCLILLGLFLLGCGAPAKPIAKDETSDQKEELPFQGDAAEQDTDADEQDTDAVEHGADADNQVDKSSTEEVLQCGDFTIVNGTYLFSFVVDKLTQGAMVDLEIIEGGFVLSGGKLDPLTWEVEDESASFAIENDANVMSGSGKVTSNNSIEGTMKQGPIEGTFTLQLQSTDRLFKN